VRLGCEFGELIEAAPATVGLENVPCPHAIDGVACQVLVGLISMVLARSQRRSSDVLEFAEMMPSEKQRCPRTCTPVP